MSESISDILDLDALTNEVFLFDGNVVLEYAQKLYSYKLLKYSCDKTGLSLKLACKVDDIQFYEIGDYVHVKLFDKDLENKEIIELSIKIKNDVAITSFKLK